MQSCRVTVSGCSTTARQARGYMGQSALKSSLASGLFLPGNICDQSTADDEYRFLEHVSFSLACQGKVSSYLSIDSKLRHRINDAQEGVNGFGLFPNHGLVDVEIDLVMVEIRLHPLAIDVEDVGVHDG